MIVVDSPLYQMLLPIGMCISHLMQSCSTQAMITTQFGYDLRII